MAQPEHYIIEKRGLYYRPNNCGYTGLKSEAGIYPFEFADPLQRHYGEDDGFKVWKADDAPEYSSRCPWDVRMKDQAYRQGWNAAMAALKGGNDG